MTPKRTALITGSGKNIGRAIALRLARDGMNLVIHGGSDLDACEQTAREAQSLGVQTHVTVGDVSNRSEVKRISEEALQTFGRVDVLIHNAATRPHQNLFEISDEEWDRVLEVNLGAAFQFCRLLIPGMLEQQWGRILTFAGVNAIRGYPNSPHVSVSKHGAWGLVKALSRDLPVRASPPTRFLQEPFSPNVPAPGRKTSSTVRLRKFLQNVLAPRRKLPP